MHNPKGHPDGDYTEAGRAFDRFHYSDPKTTTRTKGPKKARMAGDAVKNPGAASASTKPGEAPIYNGPNSRDFSRTIQDEENEKNLGTEASSTTNNTTYEIDYGQAYRPPAMQQQTYSGVNRNNRGSDGNSFFNFRDQMQFGK